MRVALFLPSPSPSSDFFLRILSTYDTIIAVDGAANMCKEWGITPQYIIGDFDSLSLETKKQFARTSTLLHRPSQETTDLQEAITFAMQTFPSAHIDIVGGNSSEEIDHTLSNMLFLRLLPPESKMITNHHTIFFLSASHQFSQKVGSLFSVFALTHVKNLSYSGAKYKLYKKSVPALWCGSRNKTTKKTCTISFDEGMLLVIFYRNP